MKVFFFKEDSKIFKSKESLVGQWPFGKSIFRVEIWFGKIRINFGVFSSATQIFFTFPIFRTSLELITSEFKHKTIFLFYIILGTCVRNTQQIHFRIRICPWGREAKKRWKNHEFHFFFPFESKVHHIEKEKKLKCIEKFEFLWDQSRVKQQYRKYIFFSW